ncbi:MAG: RNA polymerase sigma factor, partial [Solirubrobacteraceae bacterium]
PKQRTTVALRFVGDLSHAEIAGALNCSDDAARRNRHEALAKLRNELRKGWTP